MWLVRALTAFKLYGHTKEKIQAEGSMDRRCGASEPVSAWNRLRAEFYPCSMQTAYGAQLKFELLDPPSRDLGFYNYYIDSKTRKNVTIPAKNATTRQYRNVGAKTHNTDQIQMLRGLDRYSDWEIVFIQFSVRLFSTAGTSSHAMMAWCRGQSARKGPGNILRKATSSVLDTNCGEATTKPRKGSEAYRLHSPVRSPAAIFPPKRGTSILSVVNATLRSPAKLDAERVKGDSRIATNGWRIPVTWL
ncbi:hypothetical protein DFH06DRAFT_1147581 [Mycena polygramma]|nr:hypothetical protein DFH06DRAFT_1147581 [Mycena polygramma]